MQIFRYLRLVTFLMLIAIILNQPALNNLSQKVLWLIGGIIFLINLFLFLLEYRKFVQIVNSGSCKKYSLQYTGADYSIVIFRVIWIVLLTCFTIWLFVSGSQKGIVVPILSGFYPVLFLHYILGYKYENNLYVTQEYLLNYLFGAFILWKNKPLFRYNPENGILSISHSGIRGFLMGSSGTVKLNEENLQKFSVDFKDKIPERIISGLSLI